MKIIHGYIKLKGLNGQKKRKNTDIHTNGESGYGKKWRQRIKKYETESDKVKIFIYQ